MLDLLFLCFQALAAAGMVFIVASSFKSVGTFFFIVATIFITYSFFVIILETCMPNVYIHRLIVSSYNCNLYRSP